MLTLKLKWPQGQFRTDNNAKLIQVYWCPEVEQVSTAQPRQAVCFLLGYHFWILHSKIDSEKNWAIQHTKLTNLDNWNQRESLFPSPWLSPSWPEQWSGGSHCLWYGTSGNRAQNQPDQSGTNNQRIRYSGPREVVISKTHTPSPSSAGEIGQNLREVSSYST